MALTEETTGSIGSVEKLRQDIVSINVLAELKKEIIREGHVTDEQFNLAEEEAYSKGVSIGRILVDNGLFSSDSLLRFIEERLHIPFVELENYQIDEKAIHCIPPAIAYHYNVIPLFMIEGVLTIAMGDLADIISLDTIVDITEAPVEVVISSKSSIMSAITRWYGEADNQDPLVRKLIEMQHKQKKLNKELEEAYSNLKATQAQMLHREKMASIAQLAAGIAHEINTPIGFVMGNLSTFLEYQDRIAQHIQVQDEVIKDHCPAAQTEYLQEHKEELKVDYVLEDSRDLLNESLEGVEQVKVIVQTLRRFSGVDQMEYEEMDINSGIDDTLNIIWNDLEDKATIHKDYGELPLTLCYPQQLNHALMNLLVNAAQAMKEKGDIQVKTKAENKEISVSITDTGQGIPEEHLHRLFEPFFTTREPGQGTGLGLSIVHDIITKKHHGDISVVSEVGKGSTFTIKIPVVEI